MKTALVNIDEPCVLGQMVYLTSDNKVRPYEYKTPRYRCIKCKKFASKIHFLSSCCNAAITGFEIKVPIGVVQQILPNKNVLISVYA